MYQQIIQIYEEIIKKFLNRQKVIICSLAHGLTFHQISLCCSMELSQTKSVLFENGVLVPFKQYFLQVCILPPATSVNQII